MIVLADVDSKLPNLAIMRLSTYFKARGESMRLVDPKTRRSLWDGVPSAVYASSIFASATRAREAIVREWGDGVVWGGTGVDVASSLSAVDGGVAWDSIRPDYDLYPGFRHSLGFSQRGCRLRCGFCVVPRKEPQLESVATLHDIWRGGDHPRNVILLDNDPFGQPKDAWRSLFREAREGGFKVCFSQGVNLRLVDDEAANELASVEYRDNEFRERRLYTAWDNLGDEGRFKAGVSRLVAAGVPASHLMVYMLVGYDRNETWDRLWYRFAELVALGCLPYPMPYNRRERPDLCAFERWVKTGLYRAVPWPEYAPNGQHDRRLTASARTESVAAWQRVVGPNGLSINRNKAENTKRMCSMAKVAPTQGTFDFFAPKPTPPVAPEPEPEPVPSPAPLDLGVDADADADVLERGAVIVGAYRYRLWRRWDATKPTVAFVMLNPSTADGEREDQTSRKCLGFARRWDFGAFEVVNLFAYRATDPDELLSRLNDGTDVIGPELEAHARSALVGAREVIVATGAHASVTPERIRALLALVSPGVPVMCLGRTRSGYPRHPRVLGYAAAREPYGVP